MCLVDEPKIRRNCVDLFLAVTLSQTVVFSYAMVVIMTGIKILNQEKANQSQGILK